MTDNEIKTGLKCCQSDYEKNCGECPYDRFKTCSISTPSCEARMMADVLDLTNRQGAEIERLMPYGTQVKVSKKIEEEIKSEAIKELISNLENDFVFEIPNERGYFEKVVKLKHIKEVIYRGAGSTNV